MYIHVYIVSKSFALTQKENYLSGVWSDNCVISLPNRMFEHLLESSRWDDSNKWLNIGLGEEIGIIEITRTGTEGDKNTPKPGHDHSINRDKTNKIVLAKSQWNSLSLAFESLYMTAFLQSQRAITLQWPIRPKQKLRLAHLPLLINIYAKYQAIQFKTVGEVQCTRFFQTDREFSLGKSIPDRFFWKVKRP